VRLLYPFFCPQNSFFPQIFPSLSLSPSPLLNPTENPPPSTTHEPATSLCCHVAGTKNISPKISPHFAPQAIGALPPRRPISIYSHRTDPTSPTIKRGKVFSSFFFFFFSFYFLFFIFPLLW